jgi:uncharacterized protein
MKIAVVSDTHIPERAAELPEKLLAEIKGCDMVIDVGDLVELSVLDDLKRVCDDVRAVAGNMDPPQVREKLPSKLFIKAGKFLIGVTHGYGPPQRLPEMVRELFKKDKLDLIVFGHSHQPTIIEEGKPWLFNPGSPTDTIFAPYRSFGIIEITDKIELRIIKL